MKNKKQHDNDLGFYWRIDVRTMEDLYEYFNDNYNWIKLTNENKIYSDFMIRSRMIEYISDRFDLSREELKMLIDHAYEYKLKTN